MDSSACSETADRIGVISSSVALPPKRNRRLDNLPGVAVLLRQLAIGDSVLLPRREREGIYARARLLGIRISARVQDAETVRVWRIE